MWAISEPPELGLGLVSMWCPRYSCRDRFSDHHLVGGQILARDEAAPLLEEGGRPLRVAPGGERRGTFRGEYLKGVAEVGETHGLAAAEQSSVGSENSAHRCVDGKDARQDVVKVILLRHEGDSVAGPGDGRREHLNQGQSAVAPVKFRQPQGHTRHRAGRRTHVEHLGRRAERHLVGVEVGARLEVAPGAAHACGGHEEVQEFGSTVGLAHQGEAPGAEPGEAGFRGQRGCDGGHRRVGSVAPGFEHLGPGARRRRMASRHDAAGRHGHSIPSGARPSF